MHKRTLLFKNAELLVTMDDERREIRGGCLLVEGNRIVAVGGDELCAAPADEEIDLRGHIVIPGLINTHHHMFQSLTRVIPDAQDGELFDWLNNLYPIWAGLTPEMIRVSTQTAMAELMLSGCTTSSDHLYVYPNGCRLDDSIDGAREIGMRFHACRGSMSVGRSKGGLPPDELVENEQAILEDSLRLIYSYHDAQRYSMLRIALAPCSPFSVSRELMVKTAQMAREHGVSLHTHLAENDSDVSYSQAHFGMTPAQYAEDLGWVGTDVWHAHCVKLDRAGISLFARTGTGVAHCPCSNMRLASGIAPIRTMLDEGVSVGLGVDGSASNDAGNMIAETRQALLLQRVGFGPDAMNARQALEIATRGGAKVLNRDDIGYLATGMAADFVAFDLNTLNLAGAKHDPLAALVFCTPGNVAFSVINGQVVIREGTLQTIDLPSVVQHHNRLACLLVNRHRL
ncbi:8-oxoguanine deaminase [Hafnia alvei]|uniref:Cytosine/adenosine deaminase n=1 Tax=Hafnia alvei TaxID=569 RepID=A0A1C6Z528_HAFAL|nr:8-oxoguanine deaminase [Hafnia alvei]NLS56416.1 8-oxoguanine deaminase [Hafnia alvei]SCM54213.1 Cytosine/adenosine deaminase [Hafnia alvei]